MSDPPPKPKPGSLRDRIAAFEKGGATASSSGPAPAPAPAPRPKPGGLQWKPKPPSPPDSPSAASGAPKEHASSGMNASDAKASIGVGGSLKERMAALQKGGAFGTPAPPTASKPVAEKPKWKPPPKVVPVDKDDDGDDNQAPSLGAIIGGGRISSDGSVKMVVEEKEGREEGEKKDPEAPSNEGEEKAEGEPEPDPAEEERQRRAALAARMAKLGGARVGMAPMFGGGGARPPVAKKPQSPPTQPEAEAEKDEPVKLAEVSSLPAVEHPLKQDPVQSEAPADSTIDHQGSLSLASEASQSRSSPTSMPMPAVARRAGPPRKKAAKSPEPAQVPVVVSPESTLSDPIENEEAPKDSYAPETEVPRQIQAEDREKLPDEPIVSKETSGCIPDKEDEHVPQREETPVSRKQSLEQPPEVVHSEKEEEKPRSRSPIVAEQILEEPKPVEEPEEPDEEAEEAARRKRIAGKLGKMGGVNPFALPPQRQPSLPTEEAGTALTSPPPPRRQSTGRSIGEGPPASPPPPPPGTKPASRKSSLDIPPPPPPLGTKPASRKSSLDVPPISPPPTAAIKPASRKNSIVEDEKEAEDENTRALADVEEDVTVSDGEGINQRHETARDQSHHHYQDGTFTLASNSDNRAPVQEKETLSPPGEDLTTYAEDVAAVITPIQERRPPLPLPNEATRPPSQQIQPPALEAEHHAPHPPPPMRNLPPPPPRLIPQPVDEADDEGNDSDLTRSMYSERGERSPTQSQPPLSSRAPSDDEDDMPPRQLPLRRGQGEGYGYDEDADDDDSEPAPLPVPHRGSPTKRTSLSAGGNGYAPGSGSGSGAARRPPFRAIPMSPSSSQGASDVESSDGEVLQIPPRRRPDTPDSPSGNHAPLVVPPPRIEAVEPSPLRQSHGQYDEQEDEDEVGRVMRSLDRLSLPPRGGEILDEDEGDPIDPTFHSPPSRRTSTIGLSSVAAPSPPPEPPVQSKPAPAEEPEHDEEQARRQTIAERMARLGGIKFGAAPPVVPKRAAPQSPPEEGTSATAEAETEIPFEPAEMDEEEEERARKERIAAKLAGMGGMRIGMMPMGFGARPQAPSHPAPTHPVEPEQPPPLARALPTRPPPLQPHEQESDFETEDLAASQPSLSTSDDGVQVEAMESEIEEGYEDVNQSEPEEVPPPVPDRGTRRGMGPESTGVEVPPPLPPNRPPVPGTRKSSVQTNISTGRKSSIESSRDVQNKPPLKTQQSEYVMVEEPGEYLDEVPPPLPSGRGTHGRTPSARKPPAPSLAPPRSSADRQWDLTSSLEFSDTPDLSLSWTDAGHPPAHKPSAPLPPAPPAREMPPPPASQGSHPPPPPPISERQYTADDLMAIWGRVGVQACEVATSLFEKSKKSLIGDGSFKGFVHAVLSEVPNALIPSPPAPLEYGFVVYAQSGAMVQKRVSEVMPGDVVEIHDARFKGHKGLQSYTQNVEAAIGVISEYEPKKSKLRVFQANQHVGHQTVEAVSYRLDDLKSGAVKIYRVLEN